MAHVRLGQHDVDPQLSGRHLRLAVLHGNAKQYGQEANVAAHVDADTIVRTTPPLKAIEAVWGPAPGKIQSDGRGVFVLGQHFGNVFVGVQPTFGYEGDPMRLLFEHGFAPTHAFTTFYLWLRNTFKADETIRGIEVELEEVENHLNHLVDYAINYYRAIKKKYGKDIERNTEIRNFDNIEASLVAAANEKLFVNREEGFAGTGLKKDEYVCDCSDIDDIIAFRDDGTYMVTKVSPKFFVGKNIIHIDVFKRNDERTVYNAVYRDGRTGVKRFAVTAVTRDKEYNLTKGKEGSKVLYFSANPNGEAEIVTINLKPKPRLKKLSFEFDFSTLAIKGRSSQGNRLTKNAVRKVVIKEEGISTLGAMDIWFDDSIKRLNTEERGKYLGAFKGNDKILALMQSGEYRITGFDLTTHFDSDLIHIEQFDPDHVFSAVYIEGKSGLHYLKRLTVEETEKKTAFINDDPESKLITISTDERPVLEVFFDHKRNEKEIENEVLNVEEFIGVKSHKAKGKRLSKFFIKKVEWLEPI